MRHKINLNPFRLIKSLFHYYKNYDSLNNNVNKPDKDKSEQDVGMYDVYIGHLIIKNNTIIRIQQVLFIIFLISSIFSIVKLINNNYENSQRSINLENTSQMLMHAQRLAKSASIIVQDKNSFDEIVESQAKVENNLKDLLRNAKLNNIDKDTEAALNRFVNYWKNTESASGNILKNKDLILQVNANYNLIEKLSEEFLDTADKINSFVHQNNIHGIQDTVNILLIANRILYNMHVVHSLEDATPNTVFTINKDLINFEKVLNILKSNPQYEPIKDEIQTLDNIFLQDKTYITSILDIMPHLIVVKKSQEQILQDSEFLRNDLASLQRRFSVHLVPKLLGSTWVFICGSISVLSLIGLLFISLKDYKARAFAAHQRQQEAESSQKVEQQKNSINQKAIIRLMNELQEIANGNLTQQATVDANITGAIADFINYTVEELKGLVQRVQSTANQATQAFNNVQITSLELLSSTSQQAQQIEISAKAIENIAKNMHDMADKTEQSMVDAREAIEVTAEGRTASQRAISGMQAIRVQIQDTSKHIKRLGESSLQISEITDLIDNITQQTHILAINAAIQAANAGDAGRGFSVIAQEIQNLAEKSGQATQQISQLINNIQDDVQKSGSAMEHSIQGVVEGSQMTDAMDNALIKIQETNQRLVQGMEIFSNDMSQESYTANYVSENIKQLLQLTEQTLQGTTQTSESVKTLSNVMKKLEQSVSRFTVV